jgi:hypothetical protein
MLAMENFFTEVGWELNDEELEQVVGAVDIGSLINNLLGSFNALNGANFGGSNQPMVPGAECQAHRQPGEICPG